MRVTVYQRRCAGKRSLAAAAASNEIYIFSVLLLFWWPQHDAANARHQHTATLSLALSLSLRYFGALSPLWFHVRGPVPLKRRAAASLPAAGLRYRTRVSFVSLFNLNSRVYYNFFHHDVIARYVRKFIVHRNKHYAVQTKPHNTRWFSFSSLTNILNYICAFVSYICVCVLTKINSIVYIYYLVFRTIYYFILTSARLDAMDELLTFCSFRRIQFIFVVRWEQTLEESQKKYTHPHICSVGAVCVRWRCRSKNCVSRRLHYCTRDTKTHAHGRTHQNRAAHM